MYYVDTNVLLSYVFESDPYHRRSKEILESLTSEGKKLCASSLVLTEACDVLCRKISREKGWKLVALPSQDISGYASPEDKCRFLSSLVIYFIKNRLNVQFLDSEEFYSFEQIFEDLSIPRLFKESIELSFKLPIRVKDLLHLAYALILSKNCGVRYFLTLDAENFNEEVRNVAQKLLGITVMVIKEE
ncbi:type II toxin-antitoxin system VapC family toxin [Infirmifilum sp. NZ]|uniref:type II toxin-antitoxin system VapC family toxin n=1 Tax=Infirmifilum sp. NZ TaxID=2926850 RepID=UPI00279BCCB7|nr:type II toxin-antitoxin system VapC family toxin [Infirmifilum sp. NZ]UNQ73523.1 type II toxin-antitoxin system VapC family toxin [Infirmifilum sp. NZ]